MTEDFIESTFGDLDVYYPGSKRKRKSVTQKPKEPRPTISGEWDSQPLVKEINGKSVELFTVGAIAKALNRSFILVGIGITKGFYPTRRTECLAKKINTVLCAKVIDFIAELWLNT